MLLTNLFEYLSKRNISAQTQPYNQYSHLPNQQLYTNYDPNLNVATTALSNKLNVQATSKLSQGSVGKVQKFLSRVNAHPTNVEDFKWSDKAPAQAQAKLSQGSAGDSNYLSIVNAQTSQAKLPQCSVGDLDYLSIVNAQTSQAKLPQGSVDDSSISSILKYLLGPRRVKRG